jgi:hypothetical protein
MYRIQALIRIRVHSKDGEKYFQLPLNPRVDFRILIEYISYNYYYVQEDGEPLQMI